MSAETDGRTRAPSDILRLGVAAATLAVVGAVAWLFDAEVVENVANTTRGLDNISGTAIALLASAGQILGIVLFGGGLVVVVIKREWLLLGTSLAAAGIAMILFSLLREGYDTQAQVARVNDSLTLIDPERVATAAGLAAVTALVTASAPWVSRRWRRAGWCLVIILTLVRLAT